MQDCLGFVQKKEKAKFSGCIKFGVERGFVKNLVELNATDIPISRPCKNYEVLLEKIADRDFHGTLVLEMREGEVIGYAYSRTFANESLAKVLDNDMRKVWNNY